VRVRDGIAVIGFFARQLTYARHEVSPLFASD
jgi:hypothetical protein